MRASRLPVPGLRRSVTAAALALFGLIPAQAAPEADRPAAPAALASFSVDADSFTVAHVVRAGQVVPVPVELYVPHTRGHIDRSPRAQAYAGLGDAPVAELGPALGVPVEPPTFCYANFPGETEASCGIAPPGTADLPAGYSSGVGGGTVTATGSFDRPEETRTHATVAVSDQRSPSVAVAQARSSTTTLVRGGVPTGVTESVASGVVVAGVLRIEQVTSRATATAGGATGSGSAAGETVVQGASVAGRAVRLTERGLEVGGEVISPEALLGPARELALVLAGAGLTVLPLEAPVRQVADDGTSASIDVTGVTVRVDLPDGNYEDIRLGGARAAAGAIPVAAGPVGDAKPPVTDVAPGVPGDGGDGAVPPAVPAPVLPPTPTRTATVTAGAAAVTGAPEAGTGSGAVTAPPAGTGTEPLPVEAPEADPSLASALSRIAGRFRALYGAAAVAFAALCASAAVAGRGGTWHAAASRPAQNGA